MSKPKWIAGLQNHWQVSAYQVVIILIVFACTGFTVLFIKQPVLSLFGDEEKRELWHSVLYYVLILPVYNILLLIYGFIFGQFQFFWNFEKRFFRRIFGSWRKDKNQ